MDHDSCQSCRFFHSIEYLSSRTVRYCRRFPPTIALGRPVIERDWPSVLRDDWCGEFQKKGLKAVPVSQIKPVLYDEDYLPELDDDYGMIRHTNGLPD